MPGTRQVVWRQEEPCVALAAVVETPLGVMTVATTHLSFVPVWNGVQLRKVTAGLRVVRAAGRPHMPGPFPQLLSRWRTLGKLKTYPTGEPKI